jgi:CheY-like chemotaxis protein
VNSAPKQHQVLFVDDESLFLETIRDLFTDWSENAWQIHCASSADQALEILKSQKIDLAVVDVNMPVLDGVQFIRVLNRSYPELKKAVITGFASDEKRSNCLANGAELFIEKPQSAKGLRSVFTMLNELIVWKPREGFQGVLRRVGLQDVIQMECLGRNSSVLEIFNQQVRGRIYIEDGRIIHAAVGADHGEKAFQKLLALSSGEFRLQPFESPGQHTIEGQWEFLLMEAARVRDEVASQLPAAEPVPETPASVEESPAPAVAPVISPRIAETLICSGNGDALHVWQCPDPNTRVVLLHQIAQQAAQLGQLLPLGSFDRLELQLPGGRAVAQVQPDRMVFVRATGDGANPPSRTA